MEGAYRLKLQKEQFSLTDTGIVCVLNISVTRECLDLFKRTVGHAVGEGTLH